jgi:predicted metal-binding membrane protein
MYAMMTYDPIAIVLFTVSWTIGMAAMMFPSVSPMILLYGRLIRKKGDIPESGNEIIDGCKNKIDKNNKTRASFVSKYRYKISHIWKKLLIHSSNIPYASKISLFVVCYLLIWTITGVILLLLWSIPMNAWTVLGVDKKQIEIVYGILLLFSGAYQFTPFKKTCLRFCESPLSFFMRHWKGGFVGALKMGLCHGAYCLGCCWPYFLLMVALGWMNILWMGLFAGIIFAEKIWSKGIYVARITGIVFIILGLSAVLGMVSIGDFDKNISINEDQMSDDKVASQTLNSMDNNSTQHMVMNMDMKE